MCVLLCGTVVLSPFNGHWMCCLKVWALEASADAIDQYGRRANMHMRGLPEQAGEDTDEVVLNVINTKMGMTPPVQLHQLVRSHRLGRAKEGQDPKRHPRPIIIRFSSELKTHNLQQDQDLKIFLNDDLTTLRGKLAYDARVLKRDKKIIDTWTAYGKVLIKTLQNQVREIKSPLDLNLI